MGSRKFHLKANHDAVLKKYNENSKADLIITMMFIVSFLLLGFSVLSLHVKQKNQTIGDFFIETKESISGFVIETFSEIRKSKDIGVEVQEEIILNQSLNQSSDENNNIIEETGDLINK